MDLILESLDRLVRDVARETHGLRCQPFRVMRFTVERHDYDRSIGFRLDFDIPPEVTDQRYRTFALRVSEYALEHYRDAQGGRELTSPGDLAQALSPRDLQEYYEAWLLLLQARDAFATWQADSAAQPDPVTATEVLNRHYAANRAGEHLDRVRSYLFDRVRNSGRLQRAAEMMAGSAWSDEQLAQMVLRARGHERIRNLYEQQWDAVHALRYAQEFMDPAVFAPRWSEEAIAKGWELLRSNLDPDQLAEFEEKKYFHCIGGTTGHFYRITEGSQQNVYVIDPESGKATVGQCFLPVGDLVIGDVMLAQKVALELNEAEALRVAIKFRSDIGGVQEPTTKKRLKQLRKALFDRPLIAPEEVPAKGAGYDNPIMDGRRPWMTF